MSEANIMFEKKYPLPLTEQITEKPLSTFYDNCNNEAQTSSLTIQEYFQKEIQNGQEINSMQMNNVLKNSFTSKKLLEIYFGQPLQKWELENMFIKNLPFILSTNTQFMQQDFIVCLNLVSTKYKYMAMDPQNKPEEARILNAKARTLSQLSNEISENPSGSIFSSLNLFLSPTIENQHISQNKKNQTLMQLSTINYHNKMLPANNSTQQVIGSISFPPIRNTPPRCS